MSNLIRGRIFTRPPISAWLSWVVILVVALALRLAGLGAESAWIDEGYSLALARHSIQEIIIGTAADQHPPLYYLILHLWLLLGENIFNARMLSVILGTMNVYQILVFGYRIGGRWLSLGAGVLLAINPMHVWYSQEARQYMLLTVLATASMKEYWACLQGKRRWFVFGLFMLLALYTQYFTIFIIFAQVPILILTTYQIKSRILIQKWFFTMAIVGLLFLPWLPTAINQFLHHTMPWIGEPAVGEIRDVPLRLVLGSGVLILPEWLRWLGLVVLAVIFFVQLWRLLAKQTEEISSFVFLSVWGLLPYLTISLVSMFCPVFQFKQFLLLLPSFLMLATATVGLYSHWWKYGVYLCLLLIPMFSLVYQQVTLSKDDWRGLSAYIESSHENGDVIYTNPAGASLALDLYLDPSITVKGYPPDFSILTGGWEGEVVTSEVAARQMSSIAISSKRVWLVEFFPEFWDSKGLLPTWLQNNASMLDIQYFGNIHLRLYQFAQSEP